MSLSDEQITRMRRESCRVKTHSQRLVQIAGCIIAGVSPDDCPCVVDEEDRAAYEALVPQIEVIHARGGIVSFEGFDP